MTHDDDDSWMTDDVGIIISFPATTHHHARANELRYQALSREGNLLDNQAPILGAELMDMDPSIKLIIMSPLAFNLSVETD